MICNSSPLIFLSKINQISLIKKLFGHIIIPEAVKEEILIEEKEGYDLIKIAINEELIKINNPSKNTDFKIGKGENAAINLAIEKKDSLIIDDAVAIKIANSFNVKTLRTTTLIFWAVEKKILTRKQAVNVLNKLLDFGYYIAPKYYAALLTKLIVKDIEN